MPELDFNSAEQMSDLKADGSSDSGNKPPRRTAVGGSEPSPQPWIAFTAAGGNRQPVPPSSIYEFLQLQEGADFGLMERVQQHLYHKLAWVILSMTQTKRGNSKFSLPPGTNGALRPEDKGLRVVKKLCSDASFDGLTHYQVLQVLPTAEVGVISAAYEYLTRRFHPDNLSTGDDEKLKKIEDAWSTLGQRTKRQDYDKSLKHSG